MDDRRDDSLIQYNDGHAGSPLGYLPTRAWNQDESGSQGLEKNGLEGGFWARTCCVPGARSTPNFGLLRATESDLLRSIDCACCSLSIPNPTPFDLAQCIQLPGCQVNPPNFIVDAQPHSCRPNPTSDCAWCMSTPNSMPCDLVSFMKPNGCRLHVLTSTPSGPSHVDKANIYAELNALQERYRTLALALTDSSLTTPHHQDGYALLGQPRPIDVGVAVSVNPGDSGLSLGTGPIVTGPEGWGASAAGGLEANFMDQALHTQFGYAARTTGVLGSEASMLNQETPSGDHPQPNAFFDNIDSELYQIFDFNAASLPLGFDVHDGLSMSVAEGATEDELNIIPTLPSISQSDSDPTVVTPAVTRTETRHRCQSCMKTFGRSSDRDRHALEHNPSAHRYDCSFPGCKRVGRDGFLRRDKLTQHQAHMGH